MSSERSITGDMRYVLTILRGTALAALALSLAAVTAAAAVRSDGGGDSGSDGHTTPPLTFPTSTVSPGQATVPGQAPTSPGATVPAATATTPAAGAPSATARETHPAHEARPIPVPPAVPPVVGKSMAVKPVAGAVKVRLPQSSGYVPLSAAGSVPSGALVDARGGTLLLRSAVDAAGRTQTARLRGALFEVRQSGDGSGVTELILRDGRPQGCPAKGSAAIARAAAAPATTGTETRPRTRGLWAQDNHGRFRSRGRNSAATVRGTRWLTRETCAGTLTKVMRGAVDVYDRHTKRIVRVRARHSYLARDLG